MKVEKTKHGQAVTKNLGNFESLKIYNEVEARLEAGDIFKDAHATLREAVGKLNQQDLKRILGE